METGIPAAPHTQPLLPNDPPDLPRLHAHTHETMPPPPGHPSQVSDDSDDDGSPHEPTLVAGSPDPTVARVQASLDDLVQDVFRAGHSELPTPVAFFPNIPKISVPPPLPKLWQQDPARASGGRGEYDDEATEVLKWDRIAQRMLPPPPPSPASPASPDDTLREVPAIAMETLPPPAPAATPRTPRTTKAKSQDIRAAFAELKILVHAAFAELRVLESRLQRTHYVIAFATPAILALFTAILFIVQGQARATARSAPTTHAQQTIAAGADTTPRPERKTTVDVSLSASPETAQFRIDQGPILKSPYTASVPRDDREHVIVVTADGYFARVVKARFNKNVSLEIPLQQIPQVLPARAALAPAPRAAPLAVAPRAVAGAKPKPAPTAAPEPPSAPLPKLPPPAGRPDHEDPWTR